MLKKFLPSEYVKDIFQITPEKLKEQGIKAVVTDLDNTLIPWNEPLATPAIEQWFQRLKDAGISVVVVSNNNEERVKAFAEPLGIPYIAKAQKPLTKAFHAAQQHMRVKKEEMVIIGDQLITDVLGGNRAGFYTLLVVPVASSDAAITRFNRRIERKIMDQLKKRGLITWED